MKFPFFRKRRHIELPDLGDAVRVVIISPEYLDSKEAHAGSLVFGISEERSKELFEVATKAYRGNERSATAFVEISAVCKHPNELAIAISMYEFIRHKTNAGVLGMISAMLK